METQSSCRVCMKTEINLFDIFAKPFGENGPPSFAEILTKLTKYKVEKDDQLSHKICAECLKWGRSSHRFCTTAEESYYTASQILGINSNPIQTNQADQNGDSQVEANERIQIPEIFTIVHTSNTNNNTNPEPLEKRNASTNGLTIKTEDSEFPDITIVQDTNRKDNNNTNPENLEKRNSSTNDISNKTQDPECPDMEYVQECNTNESNNTNSEHLEQINSPTHGLIIKIEDSELSDSAIVQNALTSKADHTNSRHLEKRNSSKNDLNIHTDDQEFSDNANDPLLIEYDKSSNNADNNVDKEELNSSSASQGQHEFIQDDGTVSYICTICRDIFKTLFSLQKHRLIKHLRTSKDPGISYDCRTCGFSHSTKRGLKGHLKYAHKLQLDLDEEVEKSVVHHDQPHDTRVLENITQLDLKCSLCNKKYLIPSKLQHHILYRHLDQHNEDISGDPSIGGGNISDNTLNVSLECNICNESFDTKYLLQKHRVVSHLRVHENFLVEIGVNYDCKICGWSFGRKTSILHHLRAFHKNVGNLDSDVEKSKIINKKYYKDNRLLKNITPLDKTCCTCEKKFSDPFHLKKHILYTHVRFEKTEMIKQNVTSTSPKEIVNVSKTVTPIRTGKQPAAKKKLVPERKSKRQRGESVEIEEERLSNKKDSFSSDDSDMSDESFSPQKNTTSKKNQSSTKNNTSSKKRGPYKKKQDSVHIKEPVENPKPDENGENVCNICDKSFESLFDLQKHRFVTHLRTYKRNATIKTIFICPICGYDYGTRSTFQLHLKEFHKKDDDLSNEIKAARFGKLENWNDMRLLDNITDIDLNCIPCGRQFKEPLMLKYHVLYSHLKPTNLTTSIQSSITNQDEVLANGTEEISESTSSNAAQSEELQPIIKVEAEQMCVEPNLFLYNSLDVTINRNEELTPPKSCEKSINKNLSLKRTFSEAQGNDKTEEEVASGIIVQEAKRLKSLFECEVCLKSFPTEHILNNHFASAHKELKLHQCPLCHKEFNFQKLLNLHINNLHYGATFPCDKCSLEFRTVEKLKAHKRLAHSLVPQCNVLNNENNINGEIGDEDDDDDEPNTSQQQPILCAFCAKAFYNQDKLVKHLEMHLNQNKLNRKKERTLDSQIANGTGEGKKKKKKNKSNKISAPCMFCGKTFSHPDCLRRHLYIHMPYKPFVCQTCGEGFQRRSLLSYHEANYHGENTVFHHCEFCDKKCLTAIALNLHKRAKHPNLSP